MSNEHNSNAIKINNLFFYQEGKPSNVFKQIDIYSFSLYCYFLIRQGQNKNVETSIKTIYESTKIAIKKTLIDHLLTLNKKKMIKIHNLEEGKKLKYNQTLFVTVNNKVSNIDSKYFLMNTNLFIDTIQTIKSYGWSLLCLLSMLHNYTYAAVNWSFGYANPSIRGMADTLNIGETTVKKYIDILNKQKLIQVINQEPNYIGDNEFENFNNHYIVQNRIPGNKYYLDTFNKLIDSAREKQHSALADISYV